jgi:hypothetical protein
MTSFRDKYFLKFIGPFFPAAAAGMTSIVSGGAFNPPAGKFVVAET